MDAMHKLRKFLDDNHPGYSGVLLCRGEKETEEGRKYTYYFAIQKHLAGNGPTYTINDRFWYDYLDWWKEEGTPWEIIFKTTSEK